MIAAGMAGDSLPRNQELAEQFELLADLLELDGADAFRLIAYRRAAARIRESSASVARLATEGRATQIPGIGKTIQDKIAEYVEMGDLRAIAKLRDRVPVGLVEMMRVPGLGPKTARRLWQELGIDSLDALHAAAEAQQLRGLSGLGPKTEERVLAALSRPAANGAKSGRFLLGRVLPVLRETVAELAEHPACDRVSEAGSARRRFETVKDVDLIATAADPAALTAAFVAHPRVAEVAAHGPTKATVVSFEGFRFDLRVVPPESYGNLLQHFTGSKEHNVALREDAVRRRLSVSEYGVQPEDGEVFRAESEEELYAHLGYAWIPPELRENRGELEAARTGSLPELVELSDLQGDLHMHTTWSDGRGTLEEMVLAARDLGRRYVAICDHAKRLRGDLLARQTAEIETLRERVDGIEILAGIEVDIRRDGSLDLEDDLLAERDWVMASIHSGFREGSGEVTRRLLAAIENPHVDCIGHPTGRKLEQRRPYDAGWDTVFARAAETGTFLEINCQPDRLDLKDTMARAAAEAGVKLVVSTDAHRVHELANLELGVFQARRGWLTKDHVVNTRPWRDVRRMLKA
jgi:DNA polymerase (family 10)